MRADLLALTPPLVVCVAFIVGLVLFLRHQLAPKRGQDTKRRSRDTSSGSGNEPSEPS
jgi:hypothetical protein